MVCFSFIETHFAPMQYASPFSSLTAYPGAYGEAPLGKIGGEKPEGHGDILVVFI
jgi:hypothetical protein